MEAMENLLNACEAAQDSEHTVSDDRNDKRVISASETLGGLKNEEEDGSSQKRMDAEKKTNAKKRKREMKKEEETENGLTYEGVDELFAEHDEIIKRKHTILFLWVPENKRKPLHPSVIPLPVRVRCYSHEWS